MFNAGKLKCSVRKNIVCLLIKAASNKSMDVRAKQQLSYRTGLFNSELRVFGFAPRHLKRSAAFVG